MMRRSILRAASVVSAALILLVGCDRAKPIEGDGGASPAEAIEITNVSAGKLLDYFCEVGIGSEYGESADVLCKWTHRIRYCLMGDVTDEDRELIGRICDVLNEIEGFPGIYETESDVLADLTLSLVERSEIIAMFPEADESCSGMACFEWDSATGEIMRARAAVDSALTAERACTLCEEFLQSLGPARDSYMFPNSVFYQGFTLTPFPTELDFAVMKILYSPTIPVGVTRTEAMSRAARLVKWE